MDNKNAIKKLANNPHYTMNSEELKALTNLLREEAEAAKEEEQEKVVIKKVNKNRVHTTKTTLDKAKGLEEDDNVSTR